jgi:hypothetical protein
MGPLWLHWNLNPRNLKQNAEEKGTKVSKKITSGKSDPTGRKAVNTNTSLESLKEHRRLQIPQLTADGSEMITRGMGLTWKGADKFKSKGPGVGITEGPGAMRCALFVTLELRWPDMIPPKPPSPPLMPTPELDTGVCFQSGCFPDCM